MVGLQYTTDSVWVANAANFTLLNQHGMPTPPRDGSSGAELTLNPPWREPQFSPLDDEFFVSATREMICDADHTRFGRKPGVRSGESGGTREI
jgi:hypothetical protein